MTIEIGKKYIFRFSGKESNNLFAYYRDFENETVRVEGETHNSGMYYVRTERKKLLLAHDDELTPIEDKK